MRKRPCGSADFSERATGRWHYTHRPQGPNGQSDQPNWRSLASFCGAGSHCHCGPGWAAKPKPGRPVRGQQPTPLTPEPSVIGRSFCCGRPGLAPRAGSPPTRLPVRAKLRQAVLSKPITRAGRGTSQDGPPAAPISTVPPTPASVTLKRVDSYYERRGTLSEQPYGDGGLQPNPGRSCRARVDCSRRQCGWVLLVLLSVVGPVEAARSGHPASEPGRAAVG